MKICNMTATFGKLERAELKLEPGLNVIAAPNEFGKSTWAAFLLAMLYGVDTAERATKTNLPAKTKYRPWSGQNMEGCLELEYQGQHITIERSSQGRGVLNAFRAYDTESGRELEWLREDTCGQTLLGVPRSVFERSGFIRQQGLAVTEDAALESRLSSLVTTGDETVSYKNTEKRLRDLKNRRRHNKTGLLPQTETELQEIQDALDALARLGRDNMDLQARQEDLSREQTRLRRTLAGLQAAEMAKKRQQFEHARADWEKKAQCLSEKEETVAGLPELEALQELVRQLDALSEAAISLEDAKRLGVAFPQTPQCPPVFAGLDPDAVRQRAEDDCCALESLVAPPKMSPVLWIAAGALVAAGAGLLLAIPVAGVATLAAGVLVALLALARLTRCKKNAIEFRRRRAAILEPYGAQNAAQMRRLAADYREALLLYQQKLLLSRQQQEALDRRVAEAEAQRARLMAQVMAFAPEVEDPTKARAAAQQAVYRRQFWVAAAREETMSRAQFEAVQAAVGAVIPGTYKPEEPVDLTLDTVALTAQLEAVTEELQRVRSQLDLQRGRMLALGDPAVLEARREELTTRLDCLTQEYDALDLALDALGKANETLQTRFSPKLNELAAGYMAQLTGGRYDRVLLTQDMRIQARQTGDVVSHPLLSVSAGTADQLYLAVRLAIAELALEPDTPLILDDALAFFDDTRMAAALSLLQQQAQTRQILLFSCHNRERAALEHSIKS